MEERRRAAAATTAAGLALVIAGLTVLYGAAVLVAAGVLLVVVGLFAIDVEPESRRRRQRAARQPGRAVAARGRR
jgi:Flp pilus assembly protein TadB